MFLDNLKFSVSIHAYGGGGFAPPPSRQKKYWVGGEKRRKRKKRGKSGKNRKMRLKIAKGREIEKTQQSWLKIVSSYTKNRNNRGQT